MSEKRVRFDFEIEFSNGGGIQGQGFRLDIRAMKFRMRRWPRKSLQTFAF